MITEITGYNTQINDFVLKNSELLNNIVYDKNATCAQISLVCMMNKKDYIVPIPGQHQ